MTWLAKRRSVSLRSALPGSGFVYVGHHQQVRCRNPGAQVRRVDPANPPGPDQADIQSLIWHLVIL